MNNALQVQAHMYHFPPAATSILEGKPHRVILPLPFRHWLLEHDLLHQLYCKLFHRKDSRDSAFNSGIFGKFKHDICNHCCRNNSIAYSGTNLYFRVKATGSAFASLASTLTVAARPASRLLQLIIE